MERQLISTPTSVFEKIYQQSADPWEYMTSLYEQIKYGVSLAVLPSQKYECALEIGCSIGVFTAQLAKRTKKLIAIDCSHTAISYAKQQCKKCENVQFRTMEVPDQFPDETFDLIVFSEVGFYLSENDLSRAHQKIIRQLRPGGHVLLVHWAVPCMEHPLSTDEVHQQFLSSGLYLEHICHLASEMGQQRYRLDLFQRSSLL